MKNNYLKILTAVICLLTLNGCLSSSQQVLSAPSISNMFEKTKGEISKSVDDKLISQNAIQNNQSNLLGAQIGKIADEFSAFKLNISSTIGEINGIKAQLSTNIGDISAIRNTVGDVKTSIGTINNKLETQLTINNDFKANLESNIKLTNQMKVDLTNQISVNNDLKIKLENQISINNQLTAKIESLASAQIGINNKVESIKTDVTSTAGHDVIEFNTNMLNALKNAGTLTVQISCLFLVIILVICVGFIMKLDKIYGKAKTEDNARNLHLRNIADKALARLEPEQAKEIIKDLEIPKNVK